MPLAGTSKPTDRVAQARRLRLFAVVLEALATTASIALLKYAAYLEGVAEQPVASINKEKT